MGIFSALSNAVQATARAVETTAEGVDEFAAAFKEAGTLSKEGMKTYSDEVKADREKARLEAIAEIERLKAA